MGSSHSQSQSRTQPSSHNPRKKPQNTPADIRKFFQKTQNTYLPVKRTIDFPESEAALFDFTLCCLEWIEYNSKFEEIFQRDLNEIRKKLEDGGAKLLHLDVLREIGEALRFRGVRRKTDSYPVWCDEKKGLILGGGEVGSDGNGGFGGREEEGEGVLSPKYTPSENDSVDGYTYGPLAAPGPGHHWFSTPNRATVIKLYKNETKIFQSILGATATLDERLIIKHTFGYIYFLSGGGTSSYDKGLLYYEEVFSSMCRDCKKEMTTRHGERGEMETKLYELCVSATIQSVKNHVMDMGQENMEDKSWGLLERSCLSILCVTEEILKTGQIFYERWKLVEVSNSATQTATNQSSTNQPTTNQPTTNQPTTNQPPPNQPPPNQPPPNQPPTTTQANPTTNPSTQSRGPDIPPKYSSKEEYFRNLPLCEMRKYIKRRLFDSGVVVSENESSKIAAEESLKQDIKSFRQTKEFCEKKLVLLEELDAEVDIWKLKERGG